MSSSQQVRGANQLSDKEKAAIDEALKEAKSVLENSIKNAKARQDLEILVTGVMRNLQKRPIALQKTYEWSGKFIAKPTPEFVDSGAFVQQGTTLAIPLPVESGSKGAVIYGQNDDKEPQLGWLLAWDRTADMSNTFHKVYVEAGYLATLLGMTESQIVEKLDAPRTSNESRYWDSESGAAAAARLTSYAGKLALVGAAFDHLAAPIPPQ